MEPCPASKPLKTVEADPLACLGVENLQGELLAYVVCPTSNHQH